MKFIIFNFFFFLISSQGITKEIWILDKNLSNIEFELPVLLAKNIKGEFKEFTGLVEIDLNTKKNNKAIFSISMNSVDMNYKKYQSLLLSDIFFDVKKFPIALIDTRKFSYQNEKKLNLNVELTIKGITDSVPIELEVISLAEKLVQIKGKVAFLRTAFRIGTGQWKNTSILKDEVFIDVNLFFFKE